MIYIIIPVFNRLNYTVACIESLFKQNYVDYKIIIVDDGSTDATRMVLKEQYHQVIVLSTSGNLWWSATMNVGILYALQHGVNTTDYVLSLNNDLVVDADYLAELLNTAKLEPKSIVGSISVDIDNRSVEYVGHHWNAYMASKRPVLEKGLTLEAIQHSHEYLTSSLLPGRGILIPFRCFEDIGLFDAVLFPHYAGDHDFSLRAKQAGYALRISTRAVVYSYVKDTALAAMGKMSVGKYLKQSFTSIKSPLNIKTRYRWAKRHAASFTLFYFTIDLLRVSKSLAVNIIKGNR